MTDTTLPLSGGEITKQAIRHHYDLATPFYATRYTFNHLGLNAAQRGRVTLSNYPAGHMMYTEKESRQKLKADLMRFFQDGELVEGATR